VTPDEVDPPRLHKQERLAPTCDWLKYQPAAHPQAIVDNHARPCRRKHDRHLAGLIGINQEDHADDHVIRIGVDLADIPH
jgi:hypothetical protein